MKKKNKEARKLNLARETVAALDPKTLEGLAAGTGTYCPQESHVICSEVHTCVSCQTAIEA